MIRFLTKSIIILAGILGLTVSANATIYNYTYNPATADGTAFTNAGDMTSFTAQFNDLNTASNNDGLFSFQMTLDYTNVGAANVANTGWIAVTPGGSPGQANIDAARIMFDFTTGDVFVYEYVNYGMPNQSDHIITFNNALNVVDTGTALEISLSNMDVSAINAYRNDPIWFGTRFDQQIGVWGHFHKMDNFTQDGTYITNYQFNGTRSGFDDHFEDTTTVNEPIGLALLGLLFLGASLAYRRRFIS